MSLYARGLQENVFKYFEIVSSIPRGSGNCEAIADYLVAFAIEHSFKYFRDEYNNVIIYRNPTKGFENRPTVILQGHTDMVCEKNKDVDFDFINNSLNLCYEDGMIYAQGTTLGADNGIAIAIILSLLDDVTLSLPCIEAVFTSDEEIGMIGASNLNLSLLKGRKFINLDADNEGEFIVGCAGGNAVKCEIPISREYSDCKSFQVSVCGLKGGHSGVEINSGRANSNHILARFLQFLSNRCLYKIIGFNGGLKDNVIPSYSYAKISIDDYKILRKCKEEFINEVKKEFLITDPNINIEISECMNSCNALDNESTKKLIDFILIAPNGVTNLYNSDREFVETSLNLGIVNSFNDKIELIYGVRSCFEHKKMLINDILEKLCVLYGAKCSVFGDYPAWQRIENSELVSLFKDSYENICGGSPKIVSIHAGLECGFFAGEIKDLDCISIGPNIYDIHTPNERLDVESVRTLRKLLVDVLSNI